MVRHPHLHRADAARLAGGFDTSLRAYAAGDLWTRIIPLGAWRKVERTVTTHHAVLGKITRSARDLALRTADELRAERLLSATYPLADHVDAIAHAAAAGRRGAVKIAFDLRGTN